MKISNSALDWDSPNILDSRYLMHLISMIQERSFKVGIPCKDLNRALKNYSPNGILDYNVIKGVYASVLYLATYIYFNPNNLVDASFKNGKFISTFSYSIPQLNEMTGFNFFLHPLIPNQPIHYYNKFLRPLKDVLSNLRFVWFNRFVYGDDTSEKLNANVELPYVTIDGSQKLLNGPAKVTYLRNKDNWINSLEGARGNNKDMIGYYFNTYFYSNYWDNYGRDENDTIFDGWVYDNLTVYKKVDLKAGNFVKDVPYQLFMYKNCSPQNFSNWSNMYYPYHEQVAWGNFKLLKEGRVPSNGLVEVTFELPDSNFDLNVENFHLNSFYNTKYKMIDGKIKGTYNPLFNATREYGAAFYKPLLVIDLNSLLTS